MALALAIQPGLPAYGSAAVGFSATGYGLHAEGLVVQISGNNHEPWVGNFVRGMAKFDAALPHPNGAHALIIAGGEGYVVDPGSRVLVTTFGGAIVEAFPHPKRPYLILNHQNLSYEAIGPSGSVWNSQRISWDGFRGIERQGSLLKGEAWSFDDTWHKFTLNLDDGSVHGGAYPKNVA